MPPCMATNQQQTVDEMLARQMAEAEAGETSAAAPLPTVQGTPYDGGLGIPEHGMAVIYPKLPVAEEIIVNYRWAVIVFAIIDAVTTLLNLIGLIRQFSWMLVGLVLFIGPICGIMGARKLNRNMVLVYLVFCVIKSAWQIAASLILALVSFLWFLWLLLVAAVQLWITKIVASFYMALGQVESARLEELANNPQAVTRYVYW